MRWLKAMISLRKARRDAERVLAQLTIVRGFRKRDFDHHMVGESFYQETLRQIDGGRQKNGEFVAFDVILVPDPGNEYDANAVMVVHPERGQLGHLAAEDAKIVSATLNAWLAEQRVVGCRAKLTGGHGHKRNYGVMLALNFERLCKACGD